MIWTIAFLFGSITLAATPVSYPIGTACTNEWKYIGWNPADPTDQARLAKLHDAICDDVLSMALDAFTIAYNSGDPKNLIYKRFFPMSDDEDDYQAQVTDVFSKIYNEASNTGSLEPTVAGMTIDKYDFMGYCANGDAAYTAFDERDIGDGLEKIHFCDSFYDEPNYNDITCESVGPMVASNMDSFQRIMFHELFHYSTVGPASLLADQIVDTNNDDDMRAYGPYRTHGLIASGQDENIALGPINADSYAWMGVNSAFMADCGEDFMYDDPAPYTPGAPEEEDPA